MLMAKKKNLSWTPFWKLPSTNCLFPWDSMHLRHRGMKASSPYFKTDNSDCTQLEELKSSQCRSSKNCWNWTTFHLLSVILLSQLVSSGIWYKRDSSSHLDETTTFLLSLGGLNFQVMPGFRRCWKMSFLAYAHSLNTVVEKRENSLGPQCFSTGEISREGSRNHLMLKRVLSHGVRTGFCKSWEPVRCRDWMNNLQKNFIVKWAKQLYNSSCGNIVYHGIFNKG